MHHGVDAIEQIRRKVADIAEMHAVKKLSGKPRAGLQIVAK